MQRMLPILALAISATTYAQNLVYFAPGTTLKTTGGVTVTFDNLGLQNEGTIDQQAGEGVFRFSGTTNVFLSGAGLTRFDRLVMAKGGGTLGMQRHLEIGTEVNFTSGLLQLNQYNLLLGPNASLQNESATGRITSTTGYVELTRNLSAPNALNPGNLGVQITSAANLGSTVIRRGHQSQANGFGTGTSILRYFEILPANNTALNATLRFGYQDPELNGFTEDGLIVWRRSGAAAWSAEGFSLRDAAANYVERSGLNTLGRFTLSSPGNALPVQFTGWTLRCTPAGSILQWKTAGESGLTRFDLQRSSNASTWATIHSQPARNASGEQVYTFTDLPGSGPWYRVAAIEANGSVRYSSILRADCSNTSPIRLWPNPVADQLSLSITATSAHPVRIRITDSRGVVVFQQQRSITAGSNVLTLPTETLPAGTYLLTIDELGTVRSLPFVKGL